jgi:hypothetical protein
MLTPEVFVLGLLFAYLLLTFWRQILALAFVAVVALTVTGIFAASATLSHH